MTLYPFQEHGAQWLADPAYRGRILADDMGLGKTVQILEAAHRINARRVLVVTRNSCRTVWEQELGKWYPDSDYVTIDAGTMSPELRDALIRDPDAMFVILGYEMMRKLAPAIIRRKWDLVVFDEAHALANRKSQTHKLSRMLTRSATTKRVWFATGTPVQNHVQEYWPLLRVLDPQFGSYWKFVHAHCNVEPVIHPRYVAAYHAGQPLPRNAILGQQVTNITNERDPRIQQLVARVAPYVLRRTKRDVYTELPAKTYTRVPVTLDPPHRKLYTQMNSTMRCVLPDGIEVLADTTLAQQTRLLQLTIDWRLLRDAAWHGSKLEGPKADALRELIDGLQGRPFVVFSQWVHVLYLVRNMLADHGIAAAEFTGANTGSREFQLDLWNRGQAQALLVTIQAGGVGRDFTHADTAFFLDRSFNPKANLQAEDRLWRHGQSQPVNIYDIYCRNTIEEHVLHVDDIKTHVADITVEALVQ